MGSSLGTAKKEITDLSESFASVIQRKDDLLTEINNQKISQYVKSIHPELRNLDLSKLKYSKLNSKVISLTREVECLNNSYNTEEGDYDVYIEELETLNSNPYIFEVIESDYNSTQQLITSLNFKLRVLKLLLSKMQKETHSIEDLERRKQQLIDEKNFLKESLDLIKTKVKEKVQYLQVSRRRRTRYTVIALSQNRHQLRLKMQLKQELLKTLESIKSNQQKFGDIQHLELSDPSTQNQEVFEGRRSRRHLTQKSLKSSRVDSNQEKKEFFSQSPQKSKNFTPRLSSKE